MLSNEKESQTICMLKHKKNMIKWEDAKQKMDVSKLKEDNHTKR